MLGAEGPPSLGSTPKTEAPPVRPDGSQAPPGTDRHNPPSPGAEGVRSGAGQALPGPVPPGPPARTALLFVGGLKRVL